MSESEKSISASLYGIMYLCVEIILILPHRVAGDDNRMFEWCTAAGVPIRALSTKDEVYIEASRLVSKLITLRIPPKSLELVRSILYGIRVSNWRFNAKLEEIPKGSKQKRFLSKIKKGIRKKEMVGEEAFNIVENFGPLVHCHDWSREVECVGRSEAIRRRPAEVLLHLVWKASEESDDDESEWTPEGPEDPGTPEDPTVGSGDIEVIFRSALSFILSLIANWSYILA